MKFSSALALLMVQAGFSSTLSYSSEPITREFSSVDLKLISIGNGSGTLRLSSHDKAAVTVEANIVAGTKESCDVEIEKKASELVIKTNSKKGLSGLFGNKCEVNVVVKSPKMMNLNIANGSGEVHISEIEGTLTAKNGSGTLSAKGSFKEVKASVGSGEVSIAGLNDTCDLTVGSGDAALEYATVPASGKLHLKLGSGNMTITLPKKSAVQTQVKLGSGSIKNDLDNKASGTFSIEGKIGSGDLVLKNS